MSRWVGVLAAVVLSSLAGSLVHADSWAPPEVETYVSPDGRARIIITPREISSVLAYFEDRLRDRFEDRVRDRPLAGQRADSTQTTATGRLERRDAEGRWQAVWERPLVNDVAPVAALVADDGRYVVTFDNWHSMGHGDNVMVAYGPDGALIRSLRLDQILPAYFIDGIPRSVSSIRWRADGSTIDGATLRLAVVAPSTERQSETSDRFVVEVDLATGTVAEIDAATMIRLRPVACQLHRRSAAETRAWIQRERDGLRAPSTADPQAWDVYTAQAGMRLFPREPVGSEGMGLFGEAETIRLHEPAEYMYDEFLADLRALLIEPAGEQNKRLFSAVRQEGLVREVERAARGLRAGQLAGVEMAFVADEAHWARIQMALMNSGATLRQVDPNLPIPPRPERLAELPPEPVIDPACASDASAN